MAGLAGFGEFADLIPDALLLVDGSGAVVDCNVTGLRFFGLSKAELLGKRFEELGDSDPDAVAQLLRAASRTKTAVPGSLRLTTSAGEITECRCEGAVYRPRSPTEPALVLLRIAARVTAADQFSALNLRIEKLSREITLRRAAESALQEQSDRLRVTLSSIGDAVIATDSEGNITLLNSVAEALTGWSAEAALGQPLDRVFAIVNEFSGQTVESPVARVLREGGVVGLANHTMLIARNGTARPIDDSGAPIRDSDGRLIGVVLVFHDISERHALERELHRKTLRLEDADRRKDEFLSMLSHELRNPLAPLATGVHLLEQASERPDIVLRTVGMMRRQLGHITRLVDDLLDVARLTRGSIELRKTPVLLSEVLAQAVETSRPIIDSRRHRLSFEPGPPIWIDADVTRLVQVFGNLLNNAAKYTPEAGEISLATRLDPDAAVVRIRDSGDGIDPALLPSVFDLFTQGDRSLDRSQGGLGIGLTVVRAIVELHGGRVRAKSEGRGKGSTFEVEFPAKEGQFQAAPQKSSDVRLSVQPGTRVLVVDDNVDAAEALAAVVSTWGFEVVTAHTSASGLQRFAAYQPHIVLLDIGMPEMDGYSVARRIREQRQDKVPRLIAITGYGSESDRQKGMAAGFDQFLSKPVDLEGLRDLLSGPTAP